MLREEGFESWPKLTGGKGVHDGAASYPMAHDESRAYAKRLAQGLAARASERYTLLAAPSERKRGIFIDYLRNGAAIRPSAPTRRARAGFPVAAPKLEAA